MPDSVGCHFNSLSSYFSPPSGALGADVWRRDPFAAWHTEVLMLAANYGSRNPGPADSTRS